MYFENADTTGGIQTTTQKPTKLLHHQSIDSRLKVEDGRDIRDGGPEKAVTKTSGHMTTFIPPCMERKDDLKTDESGSNRAQEAISLSVSVL